MNPVSFLSLAVTGALLALLVGALCGVVVVCVDLLRGPLA